MANEQLPILLIGLSSGLALLLIFWQQRGLGRLRRELSQLRAELAAKSEQESAPKSSFSASLNQVERQLPGEGNPPRSSTEKYRYVAALAAQGMGIEAISAALQLAPAEVEQLMSLASLKPQR
jgi:hypothetical protein